jgi:hypothetical protein
MNAHRILIALALWVIPDAALAQSTLFSAPTTDIVEKGRTLLESDYLSQLPKPANADRIWLANPKVVFGLSETVEAGGNLPVSQIGGATNVAFLPNFKWKFASNDPKGLAAAAGGILFTPVNHRRDVDTYGLLYGVFSKEFKMASNGPRFTAGAYGVVGTSGFAGPNEGAILGYEQPVHSSVTIAVEWVSGKNGLGFFTPGAYFTFPRESVLAVGYSIGNDSWERLNATHNRFLYVSYGITF